MSTFRHHPDGWIYIDDIQIPLDLFLEQEPDYVLPFIGREYAQGKSHFLYTKTDQKGGEYPWNPGDVYIAKRKLYYTKRPEPEAPAPTRDQLIKAEVVKNGVTHERMTEALFRLNAYGDSALLEELKQTIADAEEKYPEKE
jgi:hypothetical protein